MLKSPPTKRPQSIDDLMTPELMARIGQLDLSSRKIFSGKLKGERRSKKRGESVEFADHRPYVTGDDIRHVDWNVFGRLDVLFLKLFLEEEDLSLHLVVDCSGSADCGEPNKFFFQQQVATALAYIGLVNLNRVAITTVGAGESGILGSLRDLRGRRRLQDVVRFMCDIEPEGVADFAEAAKRIALTRRGKGVMILLSDFFMKDGYETPLRLLVGHGYDLFALQVLSPQELNPTIGGDLRLKDVEDGDTAEVTISAPLLKKYQANMNAYCNRLHDFCVRRDIVHMTVPSDTAVDVLLLDYLRQRGLLKR